MSNFFNSSLLISSNPDGNCGTIDRLPCRPGGTASTATNWLGWFDDVERATRLFSDIARAEADDLVENDLLVLLVPAAELAHPDLRRPVCIELAKLAATPAESCLFSNIA